MQAIGDLNSLSKNIRTRLQKTIDETSGNTCMTLILALSYSSHSEIVEAVRAISSMHKNNEIELEDINEALVSNHLYTKDFPDPELLIRTSGEFRISNFLLWQLAYAEIYITPKLWPDFRKEDLYEAIVNFQNRERRFGRTSEQILDEESVKK